MYTSTQQGTSGISSGSIDALRVQLMKMSAQQLQAFATANQDDAIKLSLAAEADKYKKQHGQEALALMSGQQQKPPISQQILQSIGQPPQQPQQPMPQQGQGPMPPQEMPPQMAQAPQEMPPQEMSPQRMAYGGDVVVPEDQGIATLPVGNMDFAEGGIIGYADRGLVQGYDDRPFTGTGGVPSGAIIMGNMYQDPVTGKMVPLPERDALPFGNVPMNYAENKRLYEAKKQADLIARKTNAQNILNESPEDYAFRKVSELEAQAGKQLSPDARNMAMSKFVKEKIGGQVKRGEASLTSSGDLADPKNIYKYTPKDAADLSAGSSENTYMSGINKLLGSSQTASSMGPITKLDAKRYSFTPAQLSELNPADFAAAVESAMPKNPTASPFDAQQTELNRANTATRQNTKAELEKQFEKQGLAFKDTLEKLTSKEARVKTMEDNQLGMSMFEAGLAMMAGESPHAMVNIGKGAQVGTKKYAEIQDKVEGARDKIDDAKMKIEEFRRNEANMNARELRAAQRDIDDSVSAGAQSMINLAREQYGLNKNQAISFFSNSQLAKQFNVGESNKALAQNQSTAANIDTAFAQMANQRDIEAKRTATQLGLAALEAKRPPAEARMAMMLGTGSTDSARLESGLRKIQDLQSDKTGATYAKLYADHVTDARKQGTEPMTPTQFADSMRAILTSMAPKVVKTPGADATVLNRPK